MAAIRCKACGRLYDYRKEGCCPGCGAYNRPPKRERVNIDGTVQHMTDAAYERRQHAQGKVCFEEKECYEKKESHSQKVCYEDQARHGNRSTAAKSTDAPLYAKPAQTAREYHGAAPKPTGPVPHSKFPVTVNVAESQTTDGKKKTKLPLWCLIPLIIWAIPNVLALLAAVIGSILKALGLS